jgi:hypothetical protein
MFTAALFRIGKTWKHNYQSTKEQGTAKQNVLHSSSRLLFSNKTLHDDQP